MLTRREFLKDAALLGAAGMTAPYITCCSSGNTYDTLIRGGTVYDGTTAAPFRADVGLRADRIVAVGQSLSGSAWKTIDARNCIVAPGFIDVHDHSDYTFRGVGNDRELARERLIWKSNQAALLQGVTTVVSGNCGYGYTDMNEYYAFIDSLPFGSNTYYLTPHGMLREELFGADQPEDLTPTQLGQLKRRVAEEMEKGAVGMSTGLGYVPGYHAGKSELIELGKVLKQYNGIYASHIRNEPPPTMDQTANTRILEGIQEAIDVGRRAGIPVQISHIKGYMPCAPDVTAVVAKLRQTIEGARAEGIDVTVDQYPFTASSTVLSVLVPAEYRTATGIKDIYWSAAGKAIISQEIAKVLVNLSADRILVTSWKTYQYNTLQQIADAETAKPEDLYAEMVCNAEPPSGIFFVIDEQAMEALMPMEYIFTASDGSAVPEQASYSHPRMTSSFAKKLKVYAIDKGVLSLQSAILSMTSRPAEKFGMAERGKLVAGYYADVCVIDPATLRAPADYQHPYLYSEGVRYVLVNGVFEVENGSVTGALAGRALRRA